MYVSGAAVVVSVGLVVSHLLGVPVAGPPAFSQVVDQAASAGSIVAATAQTGRSAARKKRGRTRVLRWNTRTRIGEDRKWLRDRVRVRSKRGPKRRVVTLQRRVLGESAWRRVWTRRTNKVGRLVARYRVPTRGAHDYRLRVKRNKKARKSFTAKRRLVTLPRAAPGVSRVFAVGDIGMCWGWSHRTAELMRLRAGSLVIPGDLAYPDGRPIDFKRCYDPNYGRFRDRTFPAPGNHEYLRSKVARGYFEYFGSRVGTAEAPWYSKDIGGWRFFMLNSNCRFVGGCGTDSRQYQWLQQQLERSDKRCMAVVWHYPSWSSSTNKSFTVVRDLYRLAEDAGVDLSLVGHHHHYERFARMTADGQKSATGMRQFIVGTGGHEPHPLAATPAYGSEARRAGVHGVLQLDLTDSGYRWTFQAADSGAALDAGSDRCG